MSEIAQHTLRREFRRIDPKQTRVILLEGSPRILGAFVAKQSEQARAQLERLGVDVRTERKVTASTPRASPTTARAASAATSPRAP